MMELFSLVGNTQLRWIAFLLTADVLLGITAATMKKDFRLGRVANFMAKPVLGYIFGFAVLKIISQGVSFLESITKLAFVLIILALTGSIFNNLSRMGLPIPDWLRK